MKNKNIVIQTTTDTFDTKLNRLDILVLNAISRVIDEQVKSMSMVALVLSDTWFHVDFEKLYMLLPQGRFGPGTDFKIYQVLQNLEYHRFLKSTYISEKSCTVKLLFR